MNYKLQDLQIFDFGPSVWECYPRLTWQCIFDLYRHNGGNLDRMDNLLIDLENCKEWFEDYKKEDQKVIFSVHYETGMTSWKFTDNVDSFLVMSFPILCSEDVYVLTREDNKIIVQKVLNDE